MQPYIQERKLVGDPNSFLAKSSNCSVHSKV
jgi:hypothetical protein